MPKRIMPLTDMKVLKAKPQDKPITLFDGGGLFLLVTPSGGNPWRFKYRFDVKEKLLAFGTYPEISLLDARQKSDEARRQLANNIDPGTVRKAQKQADTQAEETFEVVAREWFAGNFHRWKETHSKRLLSSLERDIFPWIGTRPIKEIKAPELLEVLKRLESRGSLDTAHRIRTNCGKIFRYAVGNGKCERDTAADLKDALPPTSGGHMAAIVEPSQAGELLRCIDGYQGGFVVQSALQLAHKIRDPLWLAYNRTAHLDERRNMIQLWADYLDGLKTGAKVIPFKKMQKS